MRHARHGRRRALWLLPLVLAPVVAAGAWVAVRGLQAQRHLEAGRESLLAAREALLDQEPEAARQALDQAARRTAQARRLTSDPVWRAAAAVPYAGNSLQVAAGIAAAADDLARESLPPALEAARTLEPGRVRRGDGSIDVALLKVAAPQLETGAAAAAEVQVRMSGLPTRGLIGPVGTARRDFAEQLEQLSDALGDASLGLELAPALLGDDRPRRFFVMVQQTSESRGTGGLPGGFVVLEADDGRVRVTAQGSNADLRNGPVPVPPGVPQEYVDLYAVNGAFNLWQNVNLSPDLPVVARVVAARWKAQSGQDVDGVIALDGLALADLMRGSGPIDVGGETVLPEQLPEYLAIGQYRDATDPNDHRIRKEKLTLVANAATRRLTQGEGSSEELMSGLVDAIRSGHLRMASDDPALRRLADTGVQGSLPVGEAPMAYPVVFNSSAGKLDYFLDRSVSYTAGSCDGERRSSTIRVELRNSAPAAGLPPYLTIYTNAGRQLQAYDSAVTLSVYGTRGSALAGATLDGQPLRLSPTTPGGAYLSQATEAGVPLWYLFLDLPRGQVRTLELQLDEPVTAGPARVPEQPLARPLQSTVDVPTCR